MHTSSAMFRISNYYRILCNFAKNTKQYLQKNTEILKMPLYAGKYGMRYVQILQTVQKADLIIKVGNRVPNTIFVLTSL